MSYHEYANGSRRHYNGHQFKVEPLSQAELTRTPKGVENCQHAHTHVFFSGKLLADAYYCHDCGKVYPVAPANVVANSEQIVNNLRETYAQALLDQDAAWKRYSQAVEDYHAGKITQLDAEEIHQAAYSADLWAFACEEALETETVEVQP